MGLLDVKNNFFSRIQQKWNPTWKANPCINRRQQNCTFFALRILKNSIIFPRISLTKSLSLKAEFMLIGLIVSFSYNSQIFLLSSHISFFFMNSFPQVGSTDSPINGLVVLVSHSWKAWRCSAARFVTNEHDFIL